MVDLSSSLRKRRFTRPGNLRNGKSSNAIEIRSCDEGRAPKKVFWVVRPCQVPMNLKVGDRVSFVVRESEAGPKNILFSTGKLMILPSGWWFGTFVIFPYIGNNTPIWLSYFSRWLQPPTSIYICIYIYTYIYIYIEHSHGKSPVFNR